MRARVSDPIGPMWLRAFAPAIATLVMALALLLPIEATPVKGLVLYLGAALFFAAGLVLPRLAPRDATIEIGDGFIDVTNASIVGQRIRTRDVTAASTARTKDGVALALLRKGRDDRPIVIDLASDDDARRVRDALGIGHFGFGSLGWPTERSSAIGMATVMRLVAAASMTMMSLAMVNEAFLGIGAAFALPSVPLAVIFMIASLLPSQRRGPRVVLAPDGLNITTDARRLDSVPYASIADASVTEHGVRIRLHAGGVIDVDARATALGRSRMSVDERTHLVAQILSAAQRAQGVGPVPPALPERITDLAKRAERGRSWLARLDATADLLAGGASGAGYRGCGFEETDLWTTLEDHDAPADLRAAAARVLVRVSNAAKPRVDSVVARVHDDEARARIRIATDDDIEAGGERIDELDRQNSV